MDHDGPASETLHQSCHSCCLTASGVVAPIRPLVDADSEVSGGVETGHCVLCGTRNLASPFRRNPAASRKGKPNEALKP
jgi:hypothetical protein